MSNLKYDELTKDQAKEFDRFVAEQKKLAEDYPSMAELMGGLTSQGS